MVRVVPNELFYLIVGLWVEAHKKAKTTEEAIICRKIIKLLKNNCPEWQFGKRYDDKDFDITKAMGSAQ